MAPGAGVVRGRAEAGADVGLRLKTRRAEAFERMLLERAEQLRKHHGPALGGYAKSHPATIDAAQTRAAMRALGIGKIAVTPPADGWTFAGDGNLAGLVSGGATRDSYRSPRFPPPASPGDEQGQLRRQSRRSNSATYQQQSESRRIPVISAAPTARGAPLSSRGCFSVPSSSAGISRSP